MYITINHCAQQANKLIDWFRQLSPRNTSLGMLNLPPPQKKNLKTGVKQVPYSVWPAYSK